MKKQLRVRRATQGSGLGLFTHTPFRKGDFVIEYTGERISTEEADSRGGRYLFTVDKKRVIDARDRKHLARYINHSCRPNCYAELNEDDGTVKIYARRKIQEGEELTYHYGKEYWEDWIGTKNCKCEKCTAK